MRLLPSLLRSKLLLENKVLATWFTGCLRGILCLLKTCALKVNVGGKKRVRVSIPSFMRLGTRKPGLYLKSTKNLDCLSATLTFAKACAAQGVRRFVGIGTCFEYDLSHEFLAVDTQLRPTSPYAAAKAAAYFALEQYFFSAEVEFAWCRLFYLYGEGEDSRRLVAYVRGRLEAGESVDLTSGEQVRDFLDVAVAGEMIVDLARSSEVGAVNVCSAIPVTVRELVEKIADEYGRRDLLRFGVRKDERFDPNIVVGVTSGSA